MESILEIELHAAMAKEYLRQAQRSRMDFYRVSSAIETMKVAPKRKIKPMPELNDEAFDAYAEIDSGCLPPEVRR